MYANAKCSSLGKHCGEANLPEAWSWGRSPKAWAKWAQVMMGGARVAWRGVGHGARAMESRCSKKWSRRSNFFYKSVPNLGVGIRPFFSALLNKISIRGGPDFGVIFAPKILTRSPQKFYKNGPRFFPPPGSAGSMKKRAQKYVSWGAKKQWKSVQASSDQAGLA